MTKFRFCRRLIAAAVGFFSLAVGAHAECDIKFEDLKATEFSKQHDRVKQLILYNISQMDYNTAKSNYGAEVVYHGVPITASAAQFEEFRHTYDSTYYSDLFRNYGSEILKSYGDENLTNAYIACLNSNGGINARFIETGPKRARLQLTYYAPAGGPMKTVIQNITPLSSIPGVVVLDDGGCLVPPPPGKKETWSLSHKNTCTIILNLIDATIDIPVAIRTENGAASAWLPPRLRLVTDIQDIPDRYIDATGKSVTYLTANANGGNNTSNTACTAPLPPGYLMDVVKSSGLPAVVGSYASPYSGTHLQYGIQSTPDGPQRKVCFSVECGRSDGTFTACTATLNGVMRSIVWKPEGQD